MKDSRWERAAAERRSCEILLYGEYSNVELNNILWMCDSYRHDLSVSYFMCHYSQYGAVWEF